jgi:CRP-like cAMP-binding protein
MVKYNYFCVNSYTPRMNFTSLFPLLQITILEILKAYVNRIMPLEERDWKAFSSLFREKQLRKGEYFSEAGNVAQQLSLLLKGIGRSYYQNNEGVEYNKHFFVPIQLMGAYGSLLSGQPSQTSIQALTDCQLLVADFSSIVSLYENHPKIERLFRLLAEHLYAVKEKKEIEMAMMNAEERYFLFLKEFPELQNIIPQYQIASFLNITPTQLSRIRSKLLMVGW